jgi:hypothetical protein
MFVTTIDEIETPSFEGKLATLDHVLTADLFANVVEEINSLIETERSYLPAHKKSGTVAYSGQAGRSRCGSGNTAQPAHPF